MNQRNTLESLLTTLQIPPAITHTVGRTHALGPAHTIDTSLGTVLGISGDQTGRIPPYRTNGTKGGGLCGAGVDGSFVEGGWFGGDHCC
jgi:hypothetical protein